MTGIEHCLPAEVCSTLACNNAVATTDIASMIERIEYLAKLSVARACGFAALGILTFFIGMAGNLVVAFKSAGLLGLLVCVVLLLKATVAMRQPYRNTELWIMLKPNERPDSAVAQIIISAALREAYLRFAAQAAFLTSLFLASGLVGDALGL